MSPSTAIHRNIPIAWVYTPTRRYEKARVTLDADTVIVSDRRSNELERATGTLEPLSNRKWVLTLEDGSEWTVEQRSGCGCGGTKVVTL